MSKVNQKLFLIDGHALCYRSFYAIRELQNSKGQATNAVYGFVNTLKKILNEFKPTYLAVCFDSKQKTNRAKKYKEYKIQRPKMPEELREQIPIIKEIVKAYNFPIYEEAGFEADDLIATLTKESVKKGVGVVVVSDDKDLHQLAADNIAFFSARKDEILSYDKIEEKYGFEPKYIVDFLGLSGDSADNIPGVRGVGKVTATKLIQQFGTVEDVYDSIDKVLPDKVKEKLINDKDKAFLSKELATLEDDVPVDMDMKNLLVSEPNCEKLYEMFQNLEFKRFASEYKPEDAKVPELKVKAKKITTSKDLKSFLQEVKSKKHCAFYFKLQKDDLFQSMSEIALTLDGKKVVLVDGQAICDLKEMFEDKTIMKITHDVKTCIKYLKTQSIYLEKNVFDVMLGAYLIKPSAISSQLSNISWEFLSESFEEDSDVAQISSICFRIYKKLFAELKEKNLLTLLQDIEIPLSFVLAQVEAEGVKIDISFLEKLSKTCEKQIKELSKKLFDLAGEEFNLNSPKQLSVILFEKLELPVIKKTKTGFSTDESVLTTLAQTHELPKLLLEYRHINKIKSTYIDALPSLADPKTHRIHAEFNQIGAETGRLSSKNPNLQNIPIRTELGRKIRKAIVATGKDNVLVAADYSQIELRILAHLSEDKNLIKAFKEGQDIHTYTSSLMFDVDVSEVTKDMRYAAKRVNFGIVYGMGAFSLAKDLEISAKEAKEFIELYFERYPKVRTYMDAQVKLCEENGYVSTLLNRRRYIPEINSSNKQLKSFAERQAINTPVQGSAADLIKLAMISVQNQLKKQNFKAKMISTVHDELVFDTPKSEEKKLAFLLREYMENPMKLKIPIEISVKSGINWLEMEDI